MKIQIQIQENRKIYDFCNSRWLFLNNSCLLFWSFQVEHMLNDRLLHFVNIDLHDVKVLNSYSPYKILFSFSVCTLHFWNWWVVLCLMCYATRTQKLMIHGDKDEYIYIYIFLRQIHIGFWWFISYEIFGFYKCRKQGNVLTRRAFFTIRSLKPLPSTRVCI